MREERLKKISDNINAKKAQQEPGNMLKIQTFLLLCNKLFIMITFTVRTVKMAEATRMRRRQRNPPPQVFIPTSQTKSGIQNDHYRVLLLYLLLLILVTPLMSKTLKMVKER